MKQQSKDIGIFIIRFSVGIIFIVAGAGKLVNLAGTAQMFGEGIGLPMPMIFASFVMAIEILGGLALVVGVYTHVFAILLAFVMMGALLLVKGSMGYGAMRLDITLLSALVGIALIGPGVLRIGFTKDYNTNRDKNEHIDRQDHIAEN